MNPYIKRVVKAWPEDELKPGHARNEFIRKKIHCLHCRGFLKPSENATYTTLSNGALVWWHSHPSCTPDPWEEKPEGIIFPTHD